MSAEIILPCIMGRLHGQTRVFSAQRVALGDPSPCSEYSFKSYIIGGEMVRAYVHNGAARSDIEKELKKWIATKGPI